MSELIGGADAKIAWANGKNVQISHKHPTFNKEWHDLYGTLMISAFDSDIYEFRLKPRTVKLEIEVPAPFEPKEGELFYYISTEADSGFDSKKYDEQYPHFDKKKTIYGAWRNEAEIKIVFEQLRKLGVLK